MLRIRYYICDILSTLKNKILVFTLAVIMLVGNLFHYPFYLFALNKVKCEMQHELLNSVSADEKTVDLYFSTADFKKASMDEHEMCLDGKWYDIVSVAKAKDGRVTVKCLADNDESVLRSWLKKVTDENTDTNSPNKNGKHSSFTAASDFLPAEYGQLSIHSLASSKISYSSALTVILNGHTSLPELPPRA